MSLTENEKALLRASRTNEFTDAVDEGSPWVFAVISESKVQPKIARGAIASLVKKGLVIVADYEGIGKADDQCPSLRCGTGQAHCFELTCEGKRVTVELTESPDIS